MPIIITIIINPNKHNSKIKNEKFKRQKEISNIEQIENLEEP